MSGCDLPLIGRSGVVGVLAALKPVGEGHFERDDVTFLEQVARQVAIAVENALEYEKAIKDRDKETKQRLYLEEEIRAEFGAIVGESPALKSRVAPGIRRGAYGFERADPGRDGNRQGTDCPRNPQFEQPPRTGLRQIELRRDSAWASGE